MEKNILVIKLSSEKPKKYLTNTLFIDDDYQVRRSQYKNTLYIYVYKRAALRQHLIVALKVIALE